jgi:hypothetical protein
MISKKLSIMQVEKALKLIESAISYVIEHNLPRINDSQLSEKIKTIQLATSDVIVYIKKRAETEKEN